MGLFTDSVIEKDADVVEYLGEIIDWAEYEKRFDAGHGGYLFFINKKKCIDAFHTPEALARYANDARGHSRHAKLRNNAYYAVKKGKAYIRASRRLKPHEEIFVWYGNDYWRYLHAEKFPKHIGDKK